MIERPPPLQNGYIWLAHTLVPVAEARLLEGRLRGVRHELRTFDVSVFGDPRHDTEVELWVHLDDKWLAEGVLHQLLAGA